MYVAFLLHLKFGHTRREVSSLRQLIQEVPLDISSTRPLSQGGCWGIRWAGVHLSHEGGY